MDRDKCRDRGGVWDSGEEICVLPCPDDGGVDWAGVFVSGTIVGIALVMYFYAAPVELFGLSSGDLRVTALGVLAIGLAGVLGEIVSHLTPV